ncbi:MAG: farnesyl diphosphate synthase [Erysipelotrichaceae bacterium]|nr:farnesyl diphosphate synthase [Erysipelotrichaceae bacterium]
MFDTYKHLINEKLRSLIETPIGSSIVTEAMLYAIINGGKRLRPLLLMTMLADYQVDPELGLNAACALEMIHTYSLIHDDLPAMDNDDFRRGALTVHKKYNEAWAILAGDGLLTNAFSYAVNPDLNDTQNLHILIKLSEYSGTAGMLFGQEIDLKSEGLELTETDLSTMHRYKTGKLLALPFILAAIIAKQEHDIPKLDQIGVLLGQAFQIQDDIFDVTKNFKELGKSGGSDQKNHKCTYTTIMSLQAAQEVCSELFTQINTLFQSLDLKTMSTLDLINQIRERQF